MKKFTIYLGLNDKDTKKQEMDYFEAYSLASTIILNNCEACTITEANGVFTHANGEVVVEKTLKIELLFIEYETVKTIANTLKETFNQESVLLEVCEVECSFI